MPTILIAIGIISMNPLISIAQIPSMNDYNTGIKSIAVFFTCKNFFLSLTVFFPCFLNVLKGSGTVIRPRNIIKTPSRMIDYSTSNVRELLSTTIPSYSAEVKDLSSQGS